MKIIKLTDLMGLKYQASPELIIEDCLKCDNPIEEIKQCVAALIVFGNKNLSTKVKKSIHKYGLSIDYVSMETYI